MGKHLVILTDDMGVNGVRSYAQEEGLPRFPATPGMEYLESIGVRFTRFIGNPVCSSTRMQTLSGQYGFRTGIGDNCQLAISGPPSPDVEPMLAKALDATHTAGNFGKWHLGTLDNGGVESALKASVAPGGTGVGYFDTHQAGIIGNITGNDLVFYIPGVLPSLPSPGQYTGDAFTYWYYPEYNDGVINVVGDGAPANRTPGNYSTTRTVDEALSWIGAQSGDWLCVVQFQAPHNPKHKPPTAAELSPGDPLMTATMEQVLTAFEGDDTATLESLGWGESTSQFASYVAMCEAVDTELDRLVKDANVDPASNADVTIWFLCDNGPAEDAVEAPLDPEHAKNTQYELGIRLPFIVAGNGVPVGNRGTECRRLAQPADVFRTICAMEGVDLSAVFPGASFDGVDLQPLLTNSLAPGVRNFAYAEQFTLKDSSGSAIPTNAKGGITNASTGATADPAGYTVATWERSIQNEGFKLLTLMPTGPASTAGDISYELYNLRGGDRQDVTNLVRASLLTRAGVNHQEEVYEQLVSLLAEEAALLP